MYPMIPIRVFSDMPTEKCNLNCTYCFEHYKSGKSKQAIDSYNVITNNGHRDIIPNHKIFNIGGEPLLNLDYTLDLTDLIKNNSSITSKSKKNLIRDNNSLITNGTTIDKNLDTIKSNNIHLQISMDGNKEVHDNNRVYYDKHGSWDDIIKNIDILNDNEYKNYTIHSVLSSKDFNKFFEVVKYHILFIIKNKPLNSIGQNLVSLVMESEVTDEQINELICQFYEVVKYILYSDDLKEVDNESRKQMAINFLSRRGCSTCSAGHTMFILDSNNKVYGCHRLCTFDKERLELYDLNDNKIKNIDTYLQIIKYKNIEYQYGAYKNILKNKNLADQFWTYTCCSTSYNISKSTTINPAKLNTLESELSRAILYIANYFDLNIFKKERNK